MEYLQKMQVYKKVSVQKCKDVTGKIPIKARWIDTNKHDEVNTKYRRRLIPKELKQYNDSDLLSSTSTVEVLRYIASRAATGKSTERANQEHHGKRRCMSILQCAKHVVGVCGALRRRQRTRG